ncbi:putative 2-hydroxyacid dehydrogenase [Psychrosphaera saromensis]|uniref:Glycerate dehydrogenase n=2 Tax=Psychrosphaera saromensis TaxID=716813 RepID=A0A2S7V0N7_9GAMM|nr:glycerate dehydrogenase [Psychrosphaera saromensis]GHB73304.1 putative 2-hydroxyacid dehydrogenase [Psychrosphaera saromensis]GLQ13451.1 putative 2-hydroxyacid dehydrogenase [Psychrosphaera saromensis]
MTKKLTGVFLDVATFGQDINLEPLNALPIDWQMHSYSSSDEVLQRCADAQVIITNKVQLDAQTLSQLPELKLICVAATGMNNVDLVAAKSHGITVKNVKNYAGNSVAQLVISLMLELLNNTSKYRERVAQGAWSQSKSFCLLDFPITEVTGRTLGLIGYGTLAKSVEKIALAFDMKVLIAEHKNASVLRQGRTSFDDVIKHSDVISLHCPLTAETTDLISKTELELMKDTAVIINTARGGIINEADLIQALQKNIIAGAALDVVSVEPPPEEHIMLTQLDNLIITPHIAWASIEARQRLLNQVSDNIKQHFLQP